MAAVAPYVETKSTPPVPRVAASGSLRGLGGARSKHADIAQTHAGLTRFAWVRGAIDAALRDGSQKLTIETDHNGELFLQLTPGFRSDLIPWLPAPTEELRTFRFFGKAAKMGCPTWDLPAGGLYVGGTCPGADMGQTTIPQDQREKLARASREAGIVVNLLDREQGRDGPTVRDADTICQLCYATGGNYQVTNTQLGEMLRFWWSRGMVGTERGRHDFVDLMVRAIRSLKFPIEKHRHPYNSSWPLRPIRVHSSGDFYDTNYARAWIEIAEQLPDVVFWAPTRTWVRPRWLEFWRRAGEQDFPLNFIVRPSAFHTNDPAPSPRYQPWPGAWPKSFAHGTTSVYKIDDESDWGNENGKRDWRYDWQCQTYRINNDVHSCFNAGGPEMLRGGQVKRRRSDGKPVVSDETQCRLCWLNRDVTVNYTTH